MITNKKYVPANTITTYSKVTNAVTKAMRYGSNTYFAEVKSIYIYHPMRDKVQLSRQWLVTKD